MASRKTSSYRLQLTSICSSFLALLLLSAACPLAAQTSVYWDINGATAGAGGAAPGGDWNSSNAFWNTDASGGAGTLAGWSAGNIAVFSAGSDATGTYSVTLQGTHDIRGLKFEEGTVTLQGGALNFTGATSVDVAESLIATLDAVNLTGGFDLTKLGRGTLVLTGRNAEHLHG